MIVAADDEPSDPSSIAPHPTTEARASGSSGNTHARTNEFRFMASPFSFALKSMPRALREFEVAVGVRPLQQASDQRRGDTRWRGSARSRARRTRVSRPSRTL
jgi:hypothetical protein